MDNLILYIKESYNELLNKVTWPTWGSLLTNTNIVLIASIIIALVVFVMDVISKQLMDMIYSLA